MAGFNGLFSENSDGLPINGFPEKYGPSGVLGFFALVNKPKQRKSV
jgi:hypothetical protein